ncbi:MAG: Gfo/Idh/MocA family oxidoreductase [Balneolaceae bacterium]
MDSTDHKNNNGQSRREFLRRLSMGVGAAVTLPAFGPSMSMFEARKYYEMWRDMDELPESEKLGIALVGLGNYSTGQLGPALRETKLCRLSGVVTGTPAKEPKWADEYGIPESNIYNYETFDRIADNPDIDIIYIVLPNGMHAEYSIRAAEAGKHVISEKPMATSVADAQAMVDACRKADRKLSIGYRLNFEPHNEEVMRLGQKEVFGPVQQMEGGFSFDITRTPDVWRLDKELAGGGPLMDVGIYVVQASLYTTGELPLSVDARIVTENHEVFDEVEETIYWEMEFPGGATLNAESSYSEGAHYFRAEASDGAFSLGPAFGYGGIQGKSSKGQMDYPQVNQQTLQMDAFADCIFNDRKSRVPGEMGIRDMKILMAIYESAETGRRIQFDW